jgi:hypothetical protein
MKTLIAVLTAASVLTLGAQRASADNGWATTGKILTGLVIGGAVAQALTPPTVVYAAPPVVYSPPPAPVVSAAPVVTAAPVVAPAPVYVQSAPVVVYPAPAPYYRYAPRYYYPAYYYPGYCYPGYYAGPVVSFRFGFGGGRYYHRGRW